MAINNGNNESDAPEDDSDSGSQPPSSDELEDLLDDLSQSIEMEDWPTAQTLIDDLQEMVNALKSYVEEQIQ